MKLYIRAMASVVMFAAASLVPALHALSGTEIQLNVPFAFNCGKQYFAPGTYTLEVLNSNVMLVRTGQEGQALILFARQNDLVASKSGYAAFTKIGDRYFLDGIWMQGSATHISIHERKWEERASRDLALGAEPSTRVEVALLNESQPTTR